MKETRH